MKEGFVRGPRVSKIRKDANPIADRCPACLSASLEWRSNRRKCNHCMLIFLPHEAVRLPDEPPAPKPKHKGEVVPPRTAPEFRELHRDPFEHMRLALLTRGG